MRSDGSISLVSMRVCVPRTALGQLGHYEPALSLYVALLGTLRAQIPTTTALQRLLETKDTHRP